MKSTDFIKDDPLSDYKKVALLIEANCAPFLRQIKKLNTDILFRGINLPSNKILTKLDCPVNRQPLDTDSDVHIIADDWFNKKFGIRYRSNAIFCTGDNFVAHGYGNLFAVMPIGQFSFCYSSIIGDLAGEVHDIDANPAVPEGKRVFEKILQNGRYKQNTNLKKAIASECEIMIHCHSYFAIPWHIKGQVYSEICKHINLGFLG